MYRIAISFHEQTSLPICSELPPAMTSLKARQAALVKPWLATGLILFTLLSRAASGERHDRPNFHATKTSSGTPRRHRCCSGLVGRFNEIVAAELLFGFRERAVCGQRLPIA